MYKRQVRKGDVVTENQISILNQLGIMGTRVRFSQILGALLIALLFCGFTGVYVVTYYPNLLDSKGTALLASIVILSVVILRALALSLIHIFYLTDKDVVRHELVSRIVRAYEGFDEEAWKEEKISVPKGSGEKRKE